MSKIARKCFFPLFLLRLEDFLFLFFQEEKNKYRPAFKVTTQIINITLACVGSYLLVYNEV